MNNKKVKHKVKVSGYTIITHIDDPAINPEATSKKTLSVLRKRMAEKNIEDVHKYDLFSAARKLGMTDKELENLTDENKVYADLGDEAEYIDGDEDKLINERLKKRGEKRLLLNNLEYIPNYKGADYHIKRSGKWKLEKIEDIGIELPDGAILQENLTREQREEIAAQTEIERIENLTPEQKEAEKENALDALADEADRLDRRHKIRKKPFDPVAHYEMNAKRIEAKYK